MKKIEVVAAVIIDQNHKYMCVQRGTNSKLYLSEKWEFPGGKIENNENHWRITLFLYNLKFVSLYLENSYEKCSN